MKISHKMRSALPEKFKLYASHRLGLLSKIEGRNHVLTSSDLKNCLQYSEDVFGSQRYAVELALYFAIHGKWREGWLPDRFFRHKIVRRTARLSSLSEEKTLSGYFISDDSLPDIGYISNNRAFSRTWEIIQPEDFVRFIFRFSEKVVFKSNNSMQGRGVKIFTPGSIGVDDIVKLGDGCFQTFINPHATVPVFRVQSVPTLRLVTTLNNFGIPTARFAWLRIGRTGEAHVEAFSSVKIMVCCETGKLDDIGYMPDWTKITCHPDDPDNPFSKIYYPRIEDAIGLCSRLHSRMPSFISIGWDLCLDKNGDFKVMEWNQRHAITFAEAVAGPNFSDLNWTKDSYVAHPD